MSEDHRDLPVIVSTECGKGSSTTILKGPEKGKASFLYQHEVIALPAQMLREKRKLELNRELVELPTGEPLISLPRRRRERNSPKSHEKFCLTDRTCKPTSNLPQSHLFLDVRMCQQAIPFGYQRHRGNS